MNERRQIRDRDVNIGAGATLGDKHSTPGGVRQKASVAVGVVKHGHTPCEARSPQINALLSFHTGRDLLDNGRNRERQNKCTRKFHLNSSSS